MLSVFAKLIDGKKYLSCASACVYLRLLRVCLHIGGFGWERTVKSFRCRRGRKSLVFRVLRSISSRICSLYDDFVIILILKTIIESHLRDRNRWWIEVFLIVLIGFVFFSAMLNTKHWTKAICLVFSLNLSKRGNIYRVQVFVFVSDFVKRSFACKKIYLRKNYKKVS